jgi:hypothetical protein
MVSGVPAWRDNVRAMEEWLKGHPGAEWARPQGREILHRVRWTRPDGSVLEAKAADLGVLLTALERDDEARLG